MEHAPGPRAQGLYDPRHEHDSCGIGFVVDAHGRKSHGIVEQAVQVLLNLEHRGACGCEKNTGDGAGILLQMPHGFLADVCGEAGIALPGPGRYGAALVFLPTDPVARRRCEEIVERTAAEEGVSFLGWRTVPTDNASLGATARAGEPAMRQAFFGRPEPLEEDLAYERKLYVLRRRIENAVRASDVPGRGLFYVPSLSHRTLVYKGMLIAPQLPAYFPDIVDPRVESCLAMVHSRFSTNTFPNWARAHPYRFVCHNGEINTLRGNVNWMHARESLFESKLFGDDLAKILPVVDAEGSDSAMFDNVLELLVLAGRSLPHAVMMMIPEPWAGHESMNEKKRAFYEYHSCLMEPWDGPAAIAFTDGVRIGATLDRNGLRPSRYYVTKDGLVVMASEVGVLDIPADRILQKGRLQPGRMFLVDTEEGRVVADEEIKLRTANERPYAAWLRDNLVSLQDVPEAPSVHGVDHETVRQRQLAFGYTREDLEQLLTPMARDGVEPVGAMGNDTPLAVLSDKPQLLYSYFKQLFAQVTNPPVDAIREEIVMAVDTTIGPEQNLLEPTALSAHQIQLPTPILTNEELEKLRSLDTPKGRSGAWAFRSRTIPILFPPGEGGDGIERALAEACRRASEAIREGINVVVLSDRGTSAELAPIPALLALAGVHHHLIREGTRTRVGLVLESGEPREVHHFALLIGYGAGAVNPYLAFETLHDLGRQGLLPGVDEEHAVKNYIKTLSKGVVKVISKMGISTIQSYCGAQIFEAIGLQHALVDRYFTGTPSRIGGIGLDVVGEEAARRHALAYGAGASADLDGGGQYKWRHDGERHLFNPETIHRLQYACRTGDYGRFKEYSRLVDEQSRELYTLRGMMRLKPAGEPVAIDEVEPVESIVRRFKTGAMSYGSISQEAHESLAIAMNRIGGKSNTGEGGEDPARYVPDANGDSRSSAIKQVASARFGVTSHYLVNAKELQIKMAQGAKPGEGGQLPGRKVYPWIAKVRHSTPGVGLISPPPHHDIYSIEDLAELIHDLKNANEHARISVKLVAEVGVGTVAAGVAKAHADVVLISGHDGGTGASPLGSIKHAGVPWELGLAEANQVLLLNDLRSRIVVETDGQLKTGRDVVVAALLGAEEFGFATAPLVVLGCVMMRVCHLNTCAVGVATQDPQLRARFTGNPDHVVHFMRFVAQEVRELMAELGFRRLEEMVGRSDCLETVAAVDHWKARGLDLSAIFHRPDVGPEVGRYCRIAQEHGLEESLDKTKLLELCAPALERGEKVSASLPIRNRNRVVGTILGSEVTRRFGAEGLPADTIQLGFQGSAGQSFGAFLPPGITLTLEGDANDYVGKGLSGGRIVVFPPRGSTFVPEQNMIVGNVALYGATAGEAFFYGAAGERFCVRNSGAVSVVESVGDHACEYMTGGRVVVLGQTGRNFAAGMTGGIAYVLDEDLDFAMRCNKEMVQLHRCDDAEEVEILKDLVFRHSQATGSARAARILVDWDYFVSRFVRVVPNDYKRVLDTQRRMRESGLSPEEAAMAAFELNVQDSARVGGK
ncbi:MAG TPA: glutamate synthase large subunit [Vicinamibacteria bacterium]|nr:glutamate synthase large subunit [Vicinamibacteria bacterium]